MDKISDAILFEIDQDRQDKVTTINTIKETIVQFTEMGFIKNVVIKKEGNHYSWSGKRDLGLYKEKFETKFYAKLKEFYSKESAKWFNECSCYEFLQKVQARIEREENNADLFL